MIGRTTVPERLSRVRLQHKHKGRFDVIISKSITMVASHFCPQRISLEAANAAGCSAVSSQLMINLAKVYLRGI